MSLQDSHKKTESKERLMLYPKNIEEKIGFDKVRILLKDKCLSSLGTDLVDKIRFSFNFDMIKKWISQTGEFKRIIEVNEPFPSTNYINAVGYLDKIRIPGTFLNEEEWFDVSLSLKTIIDCLKFLRRKKEDYPALYDLSENIYIDENILTEIDKIIDEKGNIRPNASPELSRIKGELLTQERRARKVLDQILQNAIKQGITEGDVSLTIRNGRMVIPVNVAYKRQIKGYIQDESASGQTVYIEPAESLEINNEIKDLEYQQKREIVRLLINLSDKFRPSIPEVRKAYQFLGIVDFIRAKAKLATDLEASITEISSETEVIWNEAKHPLLFLSHQKQGKAVVPLNIKIDKDQRILVVSGPNAGGKSVCLKTVGLIQYMFQCGLLVPVKENSKLGIYKNIFIDIGDEQSIENDLSTYSSHLTNMKYFVNHADKNTLFLIDEFGTGTEPQIGGAIAESILDHFNHSESYGIVTTHYANLKKYADTNEKVKNAAMKFDLDKLEPLYELEIGKPGSSFAVEIAQKIGLPGKILNKAKQKVGYEQIRFDKMLSKLEWEKRQYDEKMMEVNLENQKLKQIIEEYTGLKNVLENNKKRILNEAKEEAQKVINEANRQVERTIREIKEKKAEKEHTKKMRQELEKYRTNLTKEPAGKEEVPAYEISAGDITEGDWVRIKGQEAVGQVLNIKDKSAEISIGDLKSKIKLNRLEKVTRKERKTQSSRSYASKGLDLNQKMADFNPNIDVRGQRTDRVLPKIDAMLDNALLLGQKDIRIVHGKGDGILRKMIRDHLKSYPSVKAVKDEHVERGGSGVTIVELG